MSIIRHQLAGFPPSTSPSPHATEHKGMIQLTGQFARDLDDPGAPLPAGIAAQTEATLRNMARVLAALGLEWRHLLAMRVYLTHFELDYDAMNLAYAAVIPAGARPARTCVGVQALVRGALIEMDCTALRN